MSGMLEGVEDGGTGSVRQIQFTRGVRSKIVADDPIDFGPERLDCDWKLLAHASIGTEAKLTRLPFQPHLCVGIVDRVSNGLVGAGYTGDEGLFVVLRCADWG